MKPHLLLFLLLLIVSFSFNTTRATAQCSEFYGLFSSGGAYHNGAIYKTDGNGDNFQVICSFPSDKIAVGSLPQGALCAAPNGKCYGTTYSGGTFDCGVIFEWDITTNKLTKKVDFNNAENGSQPRGPMILEDNGKFIGLTSKGGVYGGGTIFEWDPVTNMLSTKFAFQGSSQLERFLIKSNNGKYYGVSSIVGYSDLFEWDPLTNTCVKKVEFDKAPLEEVSMACGSLIQADNGKLYGITTSKGYNDEAYIFEWNPVNNAFTKKLYLTNAKEFTPYSSLIQADNGKFYGILVGSYGIVFEWDTTANICINKFKSHDIQRSGLDNYGKFNLMKASNGKIYGIYESTLSETEFLYEWDPFTNLLRIKENFGSLYAYRCSGLIEVKYAPSCTMSVKACNSYTSPSGKYLWTETGVYRDTLKNSAGNDSVITVNLVISHIGAPVMQDGINLMAGIFDADYYQWLDCNNGNKHIEGAVGQSFSPYTDGTYSLMITKNGCTDTSENISVCCQMTPDSTSCIYLSKDLIAYYPFNGNANDESGNGHHGTTNGAVFINDRFGDSNRACELNDEENTLSFSGYRLTKPNLTIAVWIKISDETTDTVIKYKTSLLSMLLRIVNHRYQAELALGGNTIILSDEKGIFEIDPEHPRFDLLMFFYDGAQLTFRINNQNVGSKDLEASSLPLLFPITLKNDIIYTSKGVVDDIRIYNRVINNREIDALNNDRIISTPILRTDSITHIGRYSGIVYITIDHNIVPDANTKGVCWGTSSNPDISNYQLVNKKVPLGTGIYSYRINLYGLTPNTTYYIRAFSMGSAGISYGNELTYTTLPQFSFGSVTDVDGNVYKTIPINDRNWMAENLKTTKYSDGSPIPNVTDMSWEQLTSGAYCWYNNDEANRNEYGSLYNYYTVTDSRHICPSGWHIPSPAEWASIPYSNDCNAYLERENLHNCVGCNLKEVGSEHWVYGKGTNETGFSALPGGVRRGQNGDFEDISWHSYFWESTGDFFHLSYNGGNSSIQSPSYVDGYSIRCIEDQEVIIITPHQSITRNTSFEVPVCADNLPEGNTISYQFSFNYDQQKIQYQDYSIEGSLSSNGSIQVNPSENKLSVAWAGQTALEDSGILVKLRFKALECGTVSPVLSNFLVNTDTVKNITNGIITISPVYGDVDDNGSIQAYDAALALQYSVGLDPLPDVDPLPWDSCRIKSANVDGESDISAYDASLILQHTVGLINLFPVENQLKGAGVPIADVTVNVENGYLVFRSAGDFKGLNVKIGVNSGLFGTPEINNSDIFIANKTSSSGYSVGIATAYSPAEGEILLKIPITGIPDQPVVLNLLVNNMEKQVNLGLPSGTSESLERYIKMYPNPANTILYFRNLIGETSISIYDLQGREVISGTITNNQVDISSLAYGLYTIRIEDDKNIIIKKLLKL